jgi:hypothetical protein
VASRGQLVEYANEYDRDDESRDETGHGNQGEDPDGAHKMCVRAMGAGLAGVSWSRREDADAHDAQYGW